MTIMTTPNIINAFNELYLLRIDII